MDKLTARILGPGQHCIKNNLIDSNALKVVKDLKRAGFDAYIVGGGVRDLLLGLDPKDYDVATNATPEEICDAVDRCRIIGRRFRLVHARFGREVIEVATFRSSGNPGDSLDQDSGMIINDNVFGTIDQDAERRDFSINALYYDPENKSIYDYTGGLEDLENRVLRVIGDASLRFREDPARMLRMARLQAKLDLDIENNTLAAFNELRNEITTVSSARMFDEVNKVFLTGHARKSLEKLLQHNLLEILFPGSNDALGKQPWGLPMLEAACDNTDNRIKQDKPVTPAFLYAVLLWPSVSLHFEASKNKGLPPVNAMIKAGSITLSRQQAITSIPRRHSTSMREIWELQLRLPNRQGKRAEKVLAHQKFRAAYDFLLLREASGEVPLPANGNSLGQWWTKYQTLAPAERRKMTAKLSGNQRGRKRKK